MHFPGPRLALCTVVLATLACNLPFYVQWRQSPNPIMYPTWAAQTLEVLTQQAVPATPSATPGPTPTAVVFHEAGPVTLEVSVPTDCYAGPGDNFGYVITLRPGTAANVVGRDAAQEHWLIDAPGYPGTVCWMAADNVKITGDTMFVPVSAAPEASLYTLSEPRSLRLSCRPGGGNIWNVTLRWTNTEPNATGVRIYKNNRWIDTIGPGVRQYLDSAPHRPNAGEITYGVQAANGQFVSSIVTAEIRRCE